MTDITLEEVVNHYSRGAKFYDEWQMRWLNENASENLKKYYFELFNTLSNLKSPYILEVSVGIGFNLPFYPVGAEIHGVDVCGDMLILAKRKAENLEHQKGQKVFLIERDARSLDYPDSKFDAVVSAFFVKPSEKSGIRGWLNCKMEEKARELSERLLDYGLQFCIYEVTEHRLK